MPGILYREYKIFEFWKSDKIILLKHQKWNKTKTRWFNGGPDNRFPFLWLPSTLTWQFFTKLVCHFLTRWRSTGIWSGNFFQNSAASLDLDRFSNYVLSIILKIIPNYFVNQPCITQWLKELVLDMLSFACKPFW